MTNSNAAPRPPLSAGELLDAWERASLGDALARPIALLEVAPVRPASSDLSDLAIGERDALLLRLRAEVFGPSVAATAPCPACGEPAEVEIAVDDLVAAHAPEALRVDTRTVRVDGFAVAFRLPTTRDLAALPRDITAQDGARHLLSRCVLSCRDANDAPTPVETLPGAVIGAIAEAMAAADPCADIELDITCPACAARWVAPLDPAVFVWTEVDAWAQRTLTEVDALARAYGWPEAEVLALSPWRRRRYLELALA